MLAEALVGGIVGIVPALDADDVASDVDADVTTRSALLSGRLLSRLHPPDDVTQTPSP